MNEMNPRIGAVCQFIEYIRIEYKDGLHRFGGAEGGEQAGIVVQPKVAAKPKEGNRGAHTQKKQA